MLHAMRELQTVNLQDSAIAEIPAQLFQAEWTPLLGVVYLGFNQIETIEAQTFADLEHLQQVHLEDNRVTAVQRGAFQNLKCLLAVHLEGNAIQEIQPEAFQDLPQLEKINLAYNQLTTFSFHWFDQVRLGGIVGIQLGIAVVSSGWSQTEGSRTHQVGTLSTLKVDASHNEINELTAAAAWTASPPPPYSSVRWLDLSHNNISDVDGAFFEPVRDSLARLELRGNRLRSVERDVFGQLRRLLWLDLSDNAIYTVDASAFVNTNQLQVLCRCRLPLQRCRCHPVQIPRHCSCRSGTGAALGRERIDGAAPRHVEPGVEAAPPQRVAQRAARSARRPPAPNGASPFHSHTPS